MCPHPHVVYFQSHKKASVVQITLPPWLHAYHETLVATEFTSDEQMMAVAIEISARNVTHGTGGPFGSAIFERCKTITNNSTYRIAAVGANRVVPLGNSTLHGEMVAIQFAQASLQTFSLRQVADPAAVPNKEYVLYTSCEPCAMCLGGVLWSGISEMICAATKDDAEAIGFNEGPVYADSYAHLEQSGIKIRRNVLRDQAAQVLQSYGATGIIYNS
jgi:tRNA(Arg) A34 adenosine deaminase TadA